MWFMIVSTNSSPAMDYNIDDINTGFSLDMEYDMGDMGISSKYESGNCCNAA